MKTFAKGAAATGFLRWLHTWRYFIAVGLTYAYFFQGGDANQGSRFHLTRAIVERGEVDITPDSAYTLDKGELRGAYYSDKAPGLSLLAVVPFALTKLGHAITGASERTRATQHAQLHFVTIVLSGLGGVLAAAFLSLIVARFGASPGQATGIGLLYALATPAFPFSTVLFGHQTAAALLTISFWILVKVHQRRGQSHDERGAWVGLGLLWGTVIVTEYPTALVVAVLGVHAWSLQGTWKERSRMTGWMALGAAVPLSIHFLFLYVAFGSPLHLPYENVVEPMFRAHTSSGLFGVSLPTSEAIHGVFLSRYRGLFYICPVLILFVAGFGIALERREHRRSILVIAAVVLIYSVFVTSYWAWDGGGSAGPRHIVPVLPFMVIPVLFVLQSGRVGSLAVIALAVPSILAMYAITATEVQIGEGDIHRWDILYRATLPRFLRGEIGVNSQDIHGWEAEYGAAYNLGTLVGLRPIPSLLLPLAWWAAAVAPEVSRLMRRKAGPV